ncbi:MAG TPA: guanylate kinase [Candidatus Ventricola gallistercoris]|nr:guanylate kinase [Candidatus Ventricola gallistercoris]
MHEGKKKGVLFVFSGPSGVGKGTLTQMLFNEFDGQLAYSVSATTRPPRPGEVNGRDYFFITRQEFEQRLENNSFLEHAQFAGNDYGTPRDYVTNLLDQGVNVLLEIEVQGALQVRKSMPQSVSVFILPPSFEELEHRLRGRGTESEEKIEKRLETARKEIAYAPTYDYQIVNGSDIGAAYAQLRNIFLEKTQASTAAPVA